MFVKSAHGATQIEVRSFISPDFRGRSDLCVCVCMCALTYNLLSQYLHI